MLTNASGHLLDHEIEVYDRVYNSSHARLVAWVKANVSSTQNTVITMYYGNPTAVNQENPVGVWGSEFEAIWLMNSDPSSTDLLDSTSNSHDLTVHGMSLDQRVEGKVGTAITLDGIDDYFDTNSFSGPINEFTISAWIKFDEEFNLSSGNAFLARGASTNHDSPHLRFGPTDGKLRCEVDTTLGANSPTSIKDLWTGDEWYYIGYTWSSSGEILTIYIDGSVNRIDSDPTYGGTHLDWVSWSIGSSYGIDPWGSGELSHFTISKVARSVDWIATEYNNQDDPNNFYTIGEKESSPDYWAYNSYKYRKQFTIDATKVSADLTNFPVLIDLNDTDLHDSAKVQTDGDDLIFTTTSGAKLDHEIELFDQTGNGTHAHLVAWVRVPSLSATDDTELLMYYGNKAAENQENPEGVWESNYLAVHHMEESPVGNLYDSTNNKEDLITQGSMTSGDLVNANIGQGIDFDNNDDGANSTSTITITSFTFSAWVKIDSMEDWDAVMNVGNDIGSQFRWWGVNNGIHAIDIMGTTYSFGSSLSTGVWYYLLVTYDSNGQTLRGYKDGSSQDVYSSVNLGQISTGFQIGMWDGGGYFSDYFDGIIDEARIANTLRSAGWIASEHENQLNPNTFYSVSNEEINNNWWVDESFRYRKTIIINSSKVSADLTNFPVLIDVTDSDLKTGKVQSDADDILFFDQTGVKLDHEIENFQQNSSLGRVIAWVRVPSLSSVSDTNITMYYGNSAVNSQENVNGVWIDYVGVWHLSETSGNVLDSTSYSEDGTIQGTDVTQGVTGIIGGAYNFGSGDGRIDFSDPTDGHLDIGTGNFTMSFWLKSNHSSEYQRAVYKGAHTDTTPGYGFYRRDSDNCILTAGDSSSRAKTTAVVLTDNAWTYIVAVVDRSTDEFIGYYNSIPTSPEDISALLGSMDSSIILSFGRADQEINGSLDDVRLTNSARSLSWIQTEYNNQYDPTSFISVTSEEIHPYWWADASFSKRKDIAIAKDKVSADLSNFPADLSNFPILIDIYDSDLRTDVQADAADLMFIDSSNTKLAHEIELFDQTGNGTHAHLVAWINLPTLFNNTDTLVSMYYGYSEGKRS
jgi:hypothetical protein